jgi:hypothetical protein
MSREPRTEAPSVDWEMMPSSAEGMVVGNGPLLSSTLLASSSSMPSLALTPSTRFFTRQRAASGRSSRHRRATAGAKGVLSRRGRHGTFFRSSRRSDRVRRCSPARTGRARSQGINLELAPLIPMIFHEALVLGFLLVDRVRSIARVKNKQK